MSKPLDKHYHEKKLSLVLRDLSDMPPEEYARALMRLAIVADDSVINEAEFAKHRAVAWPVGVLHKQHGFCWYEGKKPAPGTELFASPPPTSSLTVEDVRTACIDATAVFVDEADADKCREVAEYMREVLLARLARLSEVREVAHV